MIMGFDGGWLRTASPTGAEHASTQREARRLVLTPPPSVSTLACRKSVLENAITAGNWLVDGFRSSPPHRGHKKSRISYEMRDDV